MYPHLIFIFFFLSVTLEAPKKKKKKKKDNVRTRIEKTTDEKARDVV
jgi:hypothetical protein